MKPPTAFVFGAGSVSLIAVGLQVGLGGLTQSTTSAAVSSSASNATATPSPTATPTPSATTAAPEAAVTEEATTDAAASGSANAGITGTFHGGNFVDDEGWGNVQVDVVITNGVISDVIYVQANATDGRDRAFPVLRQRTLDAQSANVSTVSRATFTSLAYIESVQSALDAAGFTG